MKKFCQNLKLPVSGLALMMCIITNFIAPSSSHGQIAAEFQKKKTLATYYSAQLPIMPPMPFCPFPDLPVYEVRAGVFIYDDTKIDYAALRAKRADFVSADSAALASVDGEGQGGSTMMMMAGSGLRLLAPQVQGGTTVLRIAGNDPAMPYDVYATANVAQSNGWAYLGRMAAGQTNMAVTPPSGAVMAFQLGTAQDTDGDSLPDAFEIRVAQLDPATPDNAAGVPQQNPAQPFLVDVPPQIRVKTATGFIQSLEVNSGRHYGYYDNAGWTNEVGGAEKRYQYNGQMNDSATLIGTTTWDGAGNVVSGGAAWSGAMPPAWRHVQYVNRSESGPDYRTEFKNDIEVKIELLTGGKGLSTANNLFVLSAGATKQDIQFSPFAYVPVGAVPNGDITVLGEHPNGSAQIWKMLPDNQKVDVTPSLPAQYTNYSFGVSQQKLKLKIFRGGTDFTDRMQTVWVGESISLQVYLDPPIATLSNFQWTIPGNSISNYVTDLNTGKVHRVYAKTNSNVQYYWIDKLPRGVVQISAVVNGFTLNAQTTFEVQRPTASLSASITGTIALDNNYENNVFALHFGWIPPGIIFDYSATAFGTWDFAQLINGYVARQQDSSNGQWYRAQGSGLDTFFPMPKFRPPNGTSDSPGMEVVTGTSAAWLSSSFTMYLLFKPPGGIYVPIRKIGWNFDAVATKTGAWGSPTGATHVDASDEDTTSHPEWTDNFIYFRTFHPE